MALLERIQEKKFLGTEFATWLWYRSETGDGTLPLGAGRSCQVEFEKDLVLAGEAGEALASSLKGDTPTQAPEAGTALAAGKKVRRARLRVTADNVNYELALNGETFDFGSLKVEVPPSLPFAEAVPLRLSALGEFETVFSALFEAFIKLRLDEENWPAEARKVRDWVEAKTGTRQEP